MTSDEAMRSELAAMQLRANQLTDDTVESTRRMLALGVEAQEAGASTLAMLDEQGEQLDRIEEEVTQINKDMQEAEKNLNNMQKFCGLCVCPWNKTRNFEQSDAYQKTWKTKNEGEFVEKRENNTVKTSEPTHAEGGYIQRITNDAREDEIDGNLAQLPGVLQNLKGMAEAMGSEIDRQNQQLDRIGDKTEVTTDRLAKANRQATKILKN